MVFDKTGTLTEDGLQLLGVQGCEEENSFKEFASSVKAYLPEFNLSKEYLAQKGVILNEAMASCHAITFVNSELVGDPLEIKMF